MIRNNRESRGFTVAELIVAMSISAVTLLSGYELFTALKAAGDRQSEDLSITAGMVHGLDRIREDLLHAAPRAESSEAIFTGNSPPVEVQAETMLLLRFYSLCTGYGPRWTGDLRQMYQVHYELIRTGRFARLYRSAVLVVGTGPMSGAEGPELVLDGIERLQLAFHDGPKLEPSYSSNEQLPTGVELTVTAHGQMWPLSVKLPCGSEGQP